MSEITLESQLIDIIKDKEMPEHIKLAKVEMLVTLGVDVNMLYGAKSALFVAKECGEKAVYEFMEANGAREVFDESIRKELGKELVNKCSNPSCNVDDVKVLIEQGALDNKKDDSGEIALIGASRNGYKDIVKIIIEKGANVNAKNKDGRTALMMASSEGYKEIVELLIEEGADINARDNGGWTALMRASMGGYKEIAELLIFKGASVKPEAKFGETAMSIAKNDEVKKTMIEAVKKMKMEKVDNIFNGVRNRFER